ncbi:hypothetical protein Vretifemale_13902 [Volvox reticuliferus]|uniref:Protein kinase domain-containing protein n=1 Tax=Volvox reticuliferus TaxID=1737510 RepID=A0A8J4CQ17_9CHLO|nr:hypothetical protein Vretifemale_13902 [Volvox reticuliferus]
MLGGALGGAIGLCIVGLIGGVVTIVMYRRGCFHRRANPYSVKYFFGNRSSRNHGGKAGSVTDPDNSMNPIDGSDGSHSHLLTDRELPLPATNNQSVDFPTDPLSLVPVTSLTPLHPGIDLDVKLCGAELTLSEVTLGKGSFGRVVRGTYFGIPVAVKLINHGLVPSPECQKQEDLPQAALYQSTDATSVVSDTADNKNVLGGGIRVVMGGRGTHQQQCGSAEQLPSSASGNEDSHTTVCTDNTELAAAGAMKNDGVGAVTGGDVERGCDNGSMVRSNKFLYSSDEDSVTARSRKPAAAGDVKDMETAILDENSEEIDMTDQPSRIQQCTSYANDNNAQVYIARSPQMDHNERIASHVGAQKPRALGMNSVEATLKQEVEVLARCQHPNIVRLLAASLQAPRFCLVMELMELSLDRLLYGSGEPRHLLPLDMVLHIGDQIARGLAYLHPTIVHRDLKPANVLISNAGSSRPVVKLADFGLSRLRNTVLITTNPEVGTAPYVAPEVFDVHNFTITDRVDVYALGVILWEMLAGQRPWEGHNIVVVAVVVAMHHRRPPLGVLSETRCPPKLRSLIRACWDPVPRRRPAAAEVVKALALVQEALSVAQHQQHGGNVEQQ